jgi:hypothetical protein
VRFQKATTTMAEFPPSYIWQNETGNTFDIYPSRQQTAINGYVGGASTSESLHSAHTESGDRRLPAGLLSAHDASARVVRA